jgi:ketosteroid isomerase-like protein
MRALSPDGAQGMDRSSGTVQPVEPRDVLLAVNAAFARRDAPAMIQRFAPDAVVTDHRQQGGLGRWRGRDELLAYYAGICDTAQELREDIEIVAEQGEVVVADCMFHARLTDDGSAEEFSLSYALVVVVRDDLIQELGVHQDVAAASQAALTPETS